MSAFRLQALSLSLLLSTACAQAQAAPFQVEEASIAQIHDAIRSGATSCKGVVEAYLARARAYNGICTALLTPDGADVAPAFGMRRAGAVLKFPTRTVKASSLLPDLDQYRGLPLDYGRMEATVSDPSVMQQMGMRVGMANAGQVNALETLNLRGERSVTCKGRFDAHPSSGPLPADAPKICEEFRRQPDALERAAELDAQYGRKPDLNKLPLYCVTVAIKDVYDTRDMRSTANNDVNFAMDAPPRDATLIARLRDKGAIIYAKSVAHEFNGGPGDPGGAAKPKTNLVNGGQAFGSWSGQACNPYDTERVTRGSSGGSGAAIGANLATIGICEQSGASCQGPGSRNGVATLLTTKGLLPDNGGIGYQWFNDRAGVHALHLADTVRVLDAVKDAEQGYFDPHDPFTAVPQALLPPQPYSRYVVTSGAGKPLKGMRIAILREHMVKKTANHVAISDQIDREIKTVLRDQLGAELVETVTAGYPDDPEVANVQFSFNDALAEILPRLMPEIFTRRDKKGELYFAVPGHDVTSYDYLKALSRHQAPLTDKINMVNFAGFAALPCQNSLCADLRFDIDRYLAERGDARVRDWPSWVANAKFREDESRAGAENWISFKGHFDEGKSERLARSYVARLALEKMMRENRIDAFVHPENTVPTPKILGPNVGSISLDGITPFFQIPRVVVPAGMTQTVVEPVYVLNKDRSDYESTLPPDARPGKLAKPMPIAITFFAGQGAEPTLIRIGTAYEAATHHRQPPPDFGPVKH